MASRGIGLRSVSRFWFSRGNKTSLLVAAEVTRLEFLCKQGRFRASYSENEIRGNARPHPGPLPQELNMSHIFFAGHHRRDRVPHLGGHPGEGEHEQFPANFRALWCGIASWGLT